MNTNPNPMQCYFLKRNVKDVGRAALFDIRQRVASTCLLQSPSESPVTSPRVRSPFLKTASMSPSSLAACPFSTVMSRKSVEEINAND